MYSLFRPLLFRLEPESAHRLTLRVLRLMGAVPPAKWAVEQLLRGPDRPVHAFGLDFKNPVGLAAGYDKDGAAIHGLDALGFGHIEIGTVTPLPQPGNPPPRLFRLPEDEALINRLGFPSRGTEIMQYRLKPALVPGLVERIMGIPLRRSRRLMRPLSARLGINLGRNKSTSNEQAVFDYLSLLQNFAPVADYLTINVSSPNTEGLRQLQGRAELESLLSELHRQCLIEQKNLEKRVPLLVKLAPDLSPQELDDALEAIVRTGMDGVIAVNTTVSRPALRSRLASEQGGLSGSPLRAQSESALRQVVHTLDGRLPVVSVGGIMNAEDARRRLDMGAALVQLYTGLVYRGPGLVKQILRGLSNA